MNVQITSVHFDADQKLKDFIKSKVEKLNQFFDNIQGAEVYLKIGNTQEVNNKVTEIRVYIPGSDLFAKKQAKTFEEATDNVLEALKKQITRRKEKSRGI